MEVVAGYLNSIQQIRDFVYAINTQNEVIGNNTCG